MTAETYRLGDAMAEQQGQTVSGGSRTFCICGFFLASRRGIWVLDDAYFCGEIGCRGKREGIARFGEDEITATQAVDGCREEGTQQERLLVVAERMHSRQEILMVVLERRNRRKTTK